MLVRILAVRGSCRVRGRLARILVEESDFARQVPLFYIGPSGWS